MIAHTLDGAMLTAHLGHVTAGIKIVDPRGVDPISGYAMGIDGLFQSRDFLCFPAHNVFLEKTARTYMLNALVIFIPDSMVAL